MSFSHKAFAFSWESFAEELTPLLSQALASERDAALEAFIERNISACSSPYDGEPLGSNWKELLEVGTTQELGDFALTKYYEPTQDFGLGEAWGELEAALLAPQRAALLGTAFGQPGSLLTQGSRVATFNRQSPSKRVLLFYCAQNIRLFRSSGVTCTRSRHPARVSMSPSRREKPNPSLHPSG
jgi:hypothetical protein